MRGNNTRQYFQFQLVLITREAADVVFTQKVFLETAIITINLKSLSRDWQRNSKSTSNPVNQSPSVHLTRSSRTKAQTIPRTVLVSVRARLGIGAYQLPSDTTWMCRDHTCAVQAAFDMV